MPESILVSLLTTLKNKLESFCKSAAVMAALLHLKVWSQNPIDPDSLISLLDLPENLRKLWKNLNGRYTTDNKISA